RWFLLPAGVAPVAGPIVIRGLLGETSYVDPDWVVPFEVTEEQARRLAKDDLGQALDELKGRQARRMAAAARRVLEARRTARDRVRHSRLQNADCQPA